MDTNNNQLKSEAGRGGDSLVLGAVRAASATFAHQNGTISNAVVLEPVPVGDERIGAARGVDQGSIMTAETPNCGLPVHPICDLLPLMEDAVFRALCDDIRANGQIHPIVLHEGQIVDGRNRLLACRDVGVEPQFVDWRQVYSGPMVVTRWICSVNVERRHLTVDQVTAVEVALRAWEEQEAARQRRLEAAKRGGETAGNGRPKAGSSPAISSEGYPSKTATEERAQTVPITAPSAAVDQQAKTVRVTVRTPDQRPDHTIRVFAEKPVTDHSGDVRHKLAKEIGVSEYKVQQALNVQKAAPEMLRQVAQGSMLLREAEKRARAKVAFGRGKGVRHAAVSIAPTRAEKAEANWSPGLQLEKVILSACRRYESRMRSYGMTAIIFKRNVAGKLLSARVNYNPVAECGKESG
jgi:hypothetical protein